MLTVAGQPFTVSQDGATLGDWAVKVLPDAPPTVSFTDKPKPTERQALRIDATAGDDYGIATLTATLTLAPGAPAVLDPAPMTIPLSVPGRWPKEQAWGPEPVLVRGYPKPRLPPHWRSPRPLRPFRRP